LLFIENQVLKIDLLAEDSCALGKWGNMRLYPEFYGKLPSIILHCFSG